MFATKRLARLAGAVVIALWILVAVAPTAAAHGLTPVRAQAPNTGTCTFYLDQEDNYWDTLSWNNSNYSLNWDVKMYSEFTSSTHVYCGYVEQQTCMTAPSNFPQMPGTIWSQTSWTRDLNNYTIIRTDHWSGNWTPYATNCVFSYYSPRMAVAGNDYLGVMTQYKNFDGVNSSHILVHSWIPVGQW